MAKIEIIEINNFIKAVPKKRTWYKYFDDIFVSVICVEGRKSHIRNKTSKEYMSTDNRMCYWHCHWQYELIEVAYGNQEEGIKTYEKVIFHNDEKHIIDSVVNNISIEFQHTLSVSIEEMDSRWQAQKHFNYLPYLVLDFTEFLSPNFLQKEYKYSYNSIKSLSENFYGDEIELKIIKRLLKWTNSEYFKNGSLFIHFEDQIIRFNSNLLLGNLKHKKEEFVYKLNDLDFILKEKVEEDVVEENKREKERKIKIRLKEIENINEQKQKEAAITEEAERVIKENQKRLIKNNIDKEKSSDFNFYRIILKEEKINKRIKNIDFNSAFFEYGSYTEDIEKRKIKHHIYYSQELKILFIYSTEGVIEEKNYTFTSSKIQIIRRDNNDIRTFTYKQVKGEKLKIIEYKSEIVLGYLNSLSNYALIRYDFDEKPIIKENYIFKKKIDKFVFEDISTVLSMGLEYLIQIEGKTKEQIANIEPFLNEIYSIKDEYFFIEGILSNYGISGRNVESYYKDHHFEFKNYLLERFYILDY